MLLATVETNAASLSIFHNNDGESRLTSHAGFGGVAHFKTTLEKLRKEYAGRDQITISSGDNFLAGVVFNASLDSGELGKRTYYDAIALREIGYDAIILGNHDFDFGPAILADFIRSYRAYVSADGAVSQPAPFLSANADFSAEPDLQALKNSGAIANRTIITRGRERYGVIGVTTESLRDVSSPGKVAMHSVLQAIQMEVMALEEQGINKIILASHLQGLPHELALIPQLTGVDVVIAGGGDELLINHDNARNHVAERHGPYPVLVQDADGKTVALVTTAGEYLYVGHLQVEFDAQGEVTKAEGEPGVVLAPAANQASGLVADPRLQARVIEPLTRAMRATNAKRIASTAVFLEHSAENTNGPRIIRQQETNLGNLVADASVWAIDALGLELAKEEILIGLQNSGAIREDLDDDQDGQITQGEVLATLPFANFVALIRHVDTPTLVNALENGLALIDAATGHGADGRFPQLAGLAVRYDRTQAPGQRLVELRLRDGRRVWSRKDGPVFEGKFAIATNSFLAGAGTPDGYDWGNAERDILALPSAEALMRYLTEALNGQVEAADYGSVQGRVRDIQGR